ncbi:MAG: 3-oxoacyl-ACP synthase [Crocinitomicaceae bacterium]|nr:3-oxoacyl-ACP synthase [Crocinitomicaceae bacterium]
MKLITSSYLSEFGAFVNGTKVCSFLENENWSKELYIHLKLDYPKFHKMDGLSKMALLAVELIADSLPEQAIAEEDLTLLFSNTSSSSEFDTKFISSYTEFKAPSPSLFVYTLPNIVTGELAIKYKWYGESCFFIQEQFTAAFFEIQLKLAFQKGAKFCLCAWVEDHPLKTKECFVFLVENSTEHSLTETVEKIYKQYRNE